MNHKYITEVEAKRLDEYFPGWVNKITVELNLKSNRCCILGQITGDYHSEEAGEYRLTVPSSNKAAYFNQYFLAYWLGEINKRKLGGKITKLVNGIPTELTILKNNQYLTKDFEVISGPFEDVVKFDSLDIGSIFQYNSVVFIKTNKNDAVGLSPTNKGHTNILRGAFVQPLESYEIK